MGRTSRWANKIRIERPSNGLDVIDFHLPWIQLDYGRKLPTTSPPCGRALVPRRSDRQVEVIELSPVVWVAYLCTKGESPHGAIGVSAPALMVDAQRVWDLFPTRLKYVYICWRERRGSSSGPISDSAPP